MQKCVVCGKENPTMETLPRGQAWLCEECSGHDEAFGTLPKYDPITGERIDICTHKDGNVTVEWIKDGRATNAVYIENLRQLHDLILKFGYDPPIDS
jgi:hypothetical protein